MFNIEKAHFIIDEMIMSGYIVETNKANILNPVLAIVKAAGPWRTFHEWEMQWKQRGRLWMNAQSSSE